MTISISGSTSAPAVGPDNSSSTAPVSKPPVKTPENAADTVKLSQTAQVHLFKQEGQSLSQIASNLSISIATVDGYLGIAVPKAVPAPVPTQPPAATPSAPPQPAPQVAGK
jgi:hypothetical protein